MLYVNRIGRLSLVLIISIIIIYVNFLYNNSNPNNVQIYTKPQTITQSTAFINSTIPSWVQKYNMIELFDWTWHKNNEYKSKYLTKKSQIINSVQKHLYSESDHNPKTINDPVDYFKKFPEYGVIVDNFSQLKNPVPNPLPMDIIGHPEFSFKQQLCKHFHIENTWLACVWSAEELSTKSPTTKRSLAIGAYQSVVDRGACHGSVPGAVYNHVFTVHFQHNTNNGCFNDPVKQIPEDSNIEWYKKGRCPFQPQPAALH